MTIDYSKYPPNWKTEIRPRILERDGFKCAFCGVPNGAIGHRKDGKFYFCGRCIFDLPGCTDGKPTKIVLTIAHLEDPDPMNVADGNLAALCQACHLSHDREHHKANAAETRRNKRIATGQAVLE